MSIADKILEAAKKNSDGRWVYAGEGANGIGCSAFTRLLHYEAGIITEEQKNNNYSMWAGQGIPGYLNDPTKFRKKAWKPENLKPGDVLYSNWHHVATWDGKNGLYEACPRSHGLATNGKSAVGHFPSHGYYNCGTGTYTWDCIYEPLEQGKSRKIKQSKLISDLETLAQSPSQYSNDYPYNVLYYDGKKWFADCVNLFKALFNGRDITDKTPGSYQHDLSFTGDLTEWQMLNACSDVSTNFGKLKAGEFRCLYMDGHFGGYLGKETINPRTGGVVNVVESSPAFEDGIQYSYVSSVGTRYNYKGGTVRGKWTHHGLPDKFVENDSVPPSPTPGHSVLKYGANGAEVLELQKLLNDKSNAGLALDGSFGPATLNAVKAFQKANGLEVDGIVGPLTWAALEQNDPAPSPTDDFSVKAWQTAAKADGLYTGDIDGLFGSLSVKAASYGVYMGCKYRNLITFWQKWLKAKGYYAGEIDGSFGAQTRTAVYTAQGEYKVAQDASIGPASTKAFLDIK